MNKISPEVLRSLVAYSPDTGALVWRERPASSFKAPHMAACWNRNYAGQPALAALNSEGYGTGSVLGERMKAHRVAWAIQTGQWPKGEVDHLNGVRSDNRWANLRDVPRSRNQRNARMQRNNTSGATGVTWRGDRQKWRADMSLNGRYVFLGEFARKEDAERARIAAQRQNGFTDRHGKLAA